MTFLHVSARPNICDAARKPAARNREHPCCMYADPSREGLSCPGPRDVWRVSPSLKNTRMRKIFSPYGLHENVSPGPAVAFGKTDIPPEHFSQDVFPRTFPPPGRFSPAFLHTRTFPAPLCMTSACVAFLPESDVVDGMQLVCCTAELPTWMKPTGYRCC